MIFLKNNHKNLFIYTKIKKLIKIIWKSVSNCSKINTLKGLGFVPANLKTLEKIKIFYLFRRKKMNKQELLSAMAEKSGLTKKG